MSREKSLSQRATCGCTGRVGSAVLAPRNVLLYEYQPGRGAKHPTTFLEGFRGYLHTDGYAGYHKLPEEITVVGCWAHARRKFDEVSSPLPRATLPRKTSARGLTSATGSSPLSRSWLIFPPRNAIRSVLNRPSLCWTSFSVYGHHPLEPGAGYTRPLQAMALVSRCKHLSHGLNRFTTHPSPPGAARWNI